VFLQTLLAAWRQGMLTVYFIRIFPNCTDF
jgi:hypothetical protein